MGSIFAIFAVYRRPRKFPGAVLHTTPAQATAPAPAGMRCRPGRDEPDHRFSLLNDESRNFSLIVMIITGDYQIYKILLI
jgi:hypothetical protein